MANPALPVKTQVNKQEYESTSHLPAKPNTTINDGKLASRPVTKAGKMALSASVIGLAGSEISRKNLC